MDNREQPMDEYRGMTAQRRNRRRADDAPAARETEPAAALQGADSRVPAEARRMAAAPYGTRTPGDAGRGAGTAAARRPAAEQPYRRPEVRPEEERPARVRVGYAPGRMSEEWKPQARAREQEQESPYTRDARAYLEKRDRSMHVKEAQADVPEKPYYRTLRIVTAVLVVIGLVLAGYVFLRDRKGGKRTPEQESPMVYNFSDSGTQDLTAPADLTFSAVTESRVGEIRLADEDGKPVPAEVTSADNATGKAWILTLHVENGFEGNVFLQVRREGEEEWVTTDFSSAVLVRSAKKPTDGGEAAPAEKETEPAQEPEENPADGDEPEGEWDDGDPEGGDEPEEGWDAEETPAPAGAEEYADEPDDSGEDDRVVGELRTAEPLPTAAQATPEPTATPPLTVEASPEANPDLITSTVVYTGNKKEKTYSRPAKQLIHMPAADAYTSQNLGVLTFRGDNFRRNAAAGALEAEPTELRIIWQEEAGSVRGQNTTYYGYGWPGQPAIARWSKQVRASSNLYESKQTKEGLKEVIIAGLDGSIRFLDLEDGSLTRNSIKVTYPMRGSPSLHTRGEPFLTVGQFARKMKVKTGRIGLRQYNLYNQKELKLLDGLDGKQHRPLNDVGSFETSALVDRISDTLITAGSNGMLYLEALDSTFDYNAGVLTISPSVTVMVSRAKGQKNTALTAVESSVAAYDKYVFYADMGGVLRCVDTNSLTTVWATETGDAVMAAVAMDLTEGRELNLYTANMLANRKKGNGSIQIRRYDALSGREEWCTEIGVYKGKKDKDDVGAKASPVIGQHSLSDLVFFTVTGLSEEGRQKLGLTNEEPAALIALDKEDGQIVWTAGLDSRSESSPVAVYDKSGRGWIIQCEQNGTIRLLDGLTGDAIHVLKAEGEIEASPAVYNDTMVIGTTGKGTSFVYGIRICTTMTEETAEEKQNEDVSGGT